MVPERLTSKKSLSLHPNGCCMVPGIGWFTMTQLAFSPQNLLPFLQQREHMALVLHDDCYFYKECCGEGNGFKCFEHDMDFLLNVFPTKIQRSMDKMIELKRTVETRIEDKTLTLPHYFDMHLLIRNLRHEKANQVTYAFKTVFEKLHELQRDQALVPVYLHDSNVTEIDAVSSEELTGGT